MESQAGSFLLAVLEEAGCESLPDWLEKSETTITMQWEWETGRQFLITFHSDLVEWHTYSKADGYTIGSGDKSWALDAFRSIIFGEQE